MRRRAFILFPVVAVLAMLAASAALRDDAGAFFKGARIPRLTIELAPEAVEKLRAEPRTYAPCIVREGDRVVAAKAGVKLKGAAGSFREFDDRPAFTVDIDRFGDAEPWHGLAKFHLNNSVQDESLLSEWISSEILRSAGQPATRVQHARVVVNGRDLGLYVLKESFDRDFLERNFKNPRGNLYDGGFCQDVDGELELDERAKPAEPNKGAAEPAPAPVERADLRAIAEACAEPDMKQRWSRLEKLVDIEDFVRFMALEAMLGHWDGYCFNANNYRLYFEPGRKARFLPHGMDQCFQDPGMSVLDAPHALVARSVMKNPAWRTLYRRQVVRLLDEFDSGRLAKRVEPVRRRIQEALREVGEEPARLQAERAAEFMQRVADRERSLREQAGAPEPKPLVFKKGVAVVVKGWHSMSEVEDAVLEEADIGGAAWYRVACGESRRCIAGWRRSVLLAKGRYRFEAQLRLEGVERLADEGADAPGIGGGIRVGASRRTEDGLGGGERTVAFEFEVGEEIADVELVLELRASRGSAAFRVDSLRITRE
jgi:hypothetical protein